MLTLGEQHEGNGVTKNLSTELRIARDTFRNFSSTTKDTIAKQRDGKRSRLTAIALLAGQLEKFPFFPGLFDCFAAMKDAVVLASKILATTIRSIIDAIDRSWASKTPILDNLEDIGNMLWHFAIVTAIGILFITMMLMCGLSYGCCEAENRAGSTFIIGATSISIGSVALSLFIAFAMLLGGHGEVLLCRPLYDTPDYHLLSNLLDKPGISYANGTTNGIISDLIKPPSYANATPNNVTLAGVLTKCESNGASYHVFQMERLINVSKITDLQEYSELSNAIEVVQCAE